MREVTIIGGGLCGTLAALMLCRKGMSVTLFERRSDALAEQVEEGRSINLALSVRGIHALRRVDLDREVLARAIPMRGRYIHSTNGECSLIPYGRSPQEVIHSISRRELNTLLLDALEAETGVKVHFRHHCRGYNPDSRILSIYEETEDRAFSIDTSVVIGTDGAASAVRTALVEAAHMCCARDDLGYGYKELTIPAGDSGTGRLEPGVLHVWPRGGFMMIALPNIDGSFTCSLFLADSALPGFDQLTSPASLHAFISATFPDVLPMLPDLEGEFFRNPTSKLSTVRCAPWHYGGQALLMGDAAHAMVPFFGQGMNCAFEDCEVLLDLIDECNGDWGEIFPRFFMARKPNADAIARLALDNFVEMRDTSADPRFALKRQLEHALEDRYAGKFFSKYSMVSFHRFPYVEALERGTAQDGILMDACRSASSMDEIDIEAVFARLCPILD